MKKLLNGHENIIKIYGDKTLRGSNSQREVYILMELAEDSLISMVQRKAEMGGQFKEEQMYVI